MLVIEDHPLILILITILLVAKAQRLHSTIPSHLRRISHLLIGKRKTLKRSYFLLPAQLAPLHASAQSSLLVLISIVDIH